MVADLAIGFEERVRDIKKNIKCVKIKKNYSQGLQIHGKLLVMKLYEANLPMILLQALVIAQA